MELSDISSSSSTNLSQPNNNMAKTSASALRSRIAKTNSTKTTTTTAHHHHHHQASATSSNHSHSHNHNQHQNASCPKPCCESKSTAKPVMRQIELPNTKEGRRMALMHMIKGGSFEMFQQCADTLMKAVEAEEAEKNKKDDSEEKKLLLREELFGGYSPDGYTLAHWAVKRSPDTRFVEFLANQGINLHLPALDKVGMYPIHWAATVKNSIGIVSLLLQHTENNKKATAGSDTASSSSLFDRNDNKQDNSSPPSAALNALSSLDKSGCTPLLIAAQYGQADLSAFLIQRGVDTTILDHSLDSALHWAAYKGEMSVVGLFLHQEEILFLNNSGSESGQLKSQLGSQDKFGQTPLHLAALRGNTDVVEYLLDETECKFNTYHNSNSDHSAPVLSTPSPKDLLTMADKDGLTPLDLAIKKKRVGSEIVLREWNDRYNIVLAGNASSSEKSAKLCKYSNKAYTFIQKFCSLTNWKAWMGLGFTAQKGEDGNQIRRMKWPSALTILIMALAFSMYPLVFIPVFAGDDGKEMVLNTRFCKGLHIFTLTNMVCMWISYYFTWTTNPGCVVSLRETNSKKVPSKQNKGIKTNRTEAELCRLATKLQNEYNETLEKYADTTCKTAGSTDNSITTTPALCHTCHIVKPFRSKHCKIQRKCVLLFDHYCPFVNNTVGLYNYRYFYMFLVFLSLAQTGFVTTSIIYMLKTTFWDVHVLFTFLIILISSFGVFGLMLYHSSLIQKNLTTNEHQNVWRYQYLQDENTGQYSNPFDKGLWNNIKSRFFPGETTYTIKEDVAPASKSNSLSHIDVDDKSMRKDLLSHVV
mmetsp:Transcript_26040/g.38530  ORF Transcript_26040/g.38530 Transcript_26040/m.38530 type:complete len:814 (+) Transcript_26040:131-2572(+)